MVDGPPMFMKTIAVGPLLLVASCVTGGTTLARPRRDCLKKSDDGLVCVSARWQSREVPVRDMMTRIRSAQRGRSKMRL